MTNLIIQFPPAKIIKIDERCELLCLTRGQYLGELFGWGDWVADQALVGKTVLSIDDETKLVHDIANFPRLSLLLASAKAVQLLSKKN